LNTKKELESDELLNEYLKYDYYKENYLKKVPTDNLMYAEDIMNREKKTSTQRAFLQFIKDVPDDVNKKYKSYEDFLKEVIELNMTEEKMYKIDEDEAIAGVSKHMLYSKEVDRKQSYLLVIIQLQERSRIVSERSSQNMLWSTTGNSLKSLRNFKKEEKKEM
jgi:LPS O-antigen subunit length determinant protein (WzzB/FepE family)